MCWRCWGGSRSSRCSGVRFCAYYFVFAPPVVNFCCSALFQFRKGFQCKTTECYPGAHFGITLLFLVLVFSLFFSSLFLLFFLFWPVFIFLYFVFQLTLCISFSFPAAPCLQTLFFITAYLHCYFDLSKEKGQQIIQQRFTVAIYIFIFMLHKST